MFTCALQYWKNTVGVKCEKVVAFQNPVTFSWNVIKQWYYNNGNRSNTPYNHLVYVELYWQLPVAISSSRIFVINFFTHCILPLWTYKQLKSPNMYNTIWLVLPVLVMGYKLCMLGLPNFSLMGLWLEAILNKRLLY